MLEIPAQRPRRRSSTRLRSHSPACCGRSGKATGTSPAVRTLSPFTSNASTAWRGQVVSSCGAYRAPGWLGPCRCCRRTVGDRLSINGRLKADADQVADVAALFAPEWPAGVTPGSAEMKQVYDALRNASRTTHAAARALLGQQGRRGRHACRSRRRPRHPEAPAGERLASAADAPRWPRIRTIQTVRRPLQEDSRSAEAAAAAECAARWLGWTRWRLPSGEAKRSTILAEFAAYAPRSAMRAWRAAAGRLDESLDRCGTLSSMTRSRLFVAFGQKIRSDAAGLCPLASGAVRRAGRRRGGDHLPGSVPRAASTNRPTDAAQAEAVQTDIDAIEAALASIAHALHRRSRSMLLEEAVRPKAASSATPRAEGGRAAGPSLSQPS